MSLEKIVALAVGLLFLILGVVFLVKHIKFLKNAKEAEATITKISRDHVKETRSNGGTYHRIEVTAYVKYNVDGKSYKGIISPYKKRGLEGETEIILYDPNNPQKMRGKEGVSPFIGFSMAAIMGLAVMIIALVNL